MNDITNPVGYQRRIKKALSINVEGLKGISKNIGDKESIAQVAAISSGDEEVGELIAEAMERVGNDGVITIEESKGFATELELEKEWNLIVDMLLLIWLLTKIKWKQF